MATGQTESDGIEGAVRRVTSIAALRRLRVLVDAESAQDAANARAVPRVIVVVAACAAILAAGFLAYFR